jgi:hypothetical protein
VGVAGRKPQLVRIGDEWGFGSSEGSRVALFDTSRGVDRAACEAEAHETDREHERGK